MRTIKPLGERVVLQPTKQSQTTAGGIYIPDSAQEEKKEGIILAVGTKTDGSSLPVEKGDTVIFSGYTATEVEIDSKIVVIVDFKDIIAKIVK